MNGPYFEVLVEHILSRLLVAAAVVMALALVALLSATTSSPLLPELVLWGLAILAVLLLGASLIELGRRKRRGRA
ncbi:hypothetical protein GCM10027271_14770 [Saccharopolyspora gloriosae]